VLFANMSTTSRLAVGKSSSASIVSRLKNATSAKSQAEQSGAVTEDTFEKAFEDVPMLSIYSTKDVSEKVGKLRDILSNAACDWEKRIDALKEVRSLLLSDGVDFSELVPQLRALDPGLSVSVKDLRSQVVREACITIAYMSKRLESKFDFSAESLLPFLINLLQNSAKVMATSAGVAITFIVQYTHSARLIPCLTSNLTSKANVIRSYCCKYIGQLLAVWPKHCIERHLATLQEAVKRGLGDADADARMHARRWVVC
jgi:CLIP-associating protein 1/2